MPSHLIRLALIVLSSLLCLNCATTATISKAQDLSTSGVAYSDAVDSLITTTIDTLIEDDNNRLLAQYDAFSMPDNAEAQKKTLTGFLDTSDESLTNLIGKLNGFRGRVRVLKSYFTGLQALADADLQTDADAALGGLSNAINGFNQSLKTRHNLVITAEEQSTLSQLGGLVAKSAQSHVIRETLKRDAKVIGEYLLLQKKFVDKVALPILRDSYARSNQKERQNSVVNPYVNKQINDRKGWKDKRRDILIGSFFNQALDSVETASAQLSNIWRGILKGENDFGTVQGVLGDLTEFTNALDAFKEAEKAAKSDNPQPPDQ